MSLLLLLLATQPVERFAVVIGENAPLNDRVKALSYADDDAASTHKLLLDAGVNSRLLTAIDEDSLPLFSDIEVAGRPSLASLTSAVDAAIVQMDAAKSRGSRVELFFFYSGHGDIENGEGVVALGPDRLTRRALFDDVLERSPAHRNHVVIDACRSYFLVFARGPGGERSPHQITIENARERFPNTGFILSTSSGRDSHEWARFRGGVFSHEVRSALRGGADVDADGVITYAELGAFVEAANGAIPNSSYRPDAAILPPYEEETHKSALLDWGERGRRLGVTGERWRGHMYVEDQLGRRLVDAHPAAELDVLLRLPAETLFLRTGDGEQEYVVTATLAQIDEPLRPSSSTRRGAEHVAFEKLFVRPLSASAVARFQTTTFERAPQGTPWTQTLRTVTGWVSIATLILGGAFVTWALVERDRASHADAFAANDRIRAANTVSTIMFSLSGLSGGTYLTLRFAL